MYLTEITIAGLGALIGVVLREGGGLVRDLLHNRQQQVIDVQSLATTELQRAIAMLNSDREYWQKRCVELQGQLDDKEREQDWLQGEHHAARQLVERLRNYAFYLRKLLEVNKIPVDEWEPDSVLLDTPRPPPPRGG